MKDWKLLRLNGSSFLKGVQAQCHKWLKDFKAIKVGRDCQRLRIGPSRDTGSFMTTEAAQMWTTRIVERQSIYLA